MSAFCVSSKSMLFCWQAQYYENGHTKVVYLYGLYRYVCLFAASSLEAQ